MLCTYQLIFMCRAVLLIASLQLFNQGFADGTGQMVSCTRSSGKTFPVSSNADQRCDQGCATPQ